ncbi:lanthionine synthetase C family protein [Kitasatospora sp. NPDC093550]|uniref:lanthionine synthetase C family protein n=1 Tax=Kitasatospora sp. NPDC093550 TaxID=3364089 RepID=UPI0038031380
MAVAARRAAAWEPAVRDARTAARVRAAAADVLSRLRDPDTAEAAGRNGARRERPRWTPYGTAQGTGGLALAFGHLDRCLPGQGWDLVAHRHLARAVEGTARDPVTGVGLFSGLAGVAFTTAYLADGRGRYRTLLGDLDDSLYARIPHRLPAVDGRGLAVGTFDVVSGWTGVAAHLLARPPGPDRDRALDSLLGWLVDLCRGCPDPDGMPAWHTPHALIADEGMRARYPGAVANCGLAHGIAGPLALLSIALSDARGPAVPGHTEAIRRAASWLAARHVADARGGGYPSVAAYPAVAAYPSALADPSARADPSALADPALAEPSAADTPAAAPREPAPAPTPARDAWCYGSPGVARALWLAGTALGDRALTAAATAALRAALARPIAWRRIDSPGFCHGVAGLLQVTLRFAADTGDEAIGAAAQRLVDQLLGEYRPRSPFGYRSVEPDGTRADRVGLLEGTPGIALALLAAATPEPPSWDRFLLLS